MAHQPVGASARQDLFGGPSRAATSRSSAGPSGRGTPFTSDYDGKEGKEDDRPNSGLVSGPTKIGDDIMELEHAMGYTGHFLNTIATHPSNPTLYARTLGSVLVISDLDNPHESHYLKGHDMEITCIDISPSGDLIASGQVGSTHYKGYHAPVIVWDFQTKEKVFVLEGVTGGALGARFSPDGAFLAAWGRDGLLYVWDLRTGEVAYGKRYPSPLGIFQWVSISREGRRPTYQVVLSREAEVALHTLAFDAASRQWTFAGAPVALPGAGLVREYLSSCAASAGGGGGEYVAAGTTVGDLAVFNARNAVYRASLPVAGGGLTAVLSGPGGAGALYCGAGDGTVKRVRGEDLRWQLEAEVALGARVTGLAAAAAGAELVVGTAGGSVFRVDAETLAARPVHDSHTAGVRAVAFPRDRSDVFATAAEDGSVVVWDLNDYSVVCRAGSLRSGGANCLGWVGEAEVVVGFEDAAVRAYQVGLGWAGCAPSPNITAPFTKGGHGGAGVGDPGGAPGAGDLPGRAHGRPDGVSRHRRRGRRRPRVGPALARDAAAVRRAQEGRLGRAGGPGAAAPRALGRAGLRGLHVRHPARAPDRLPHGAGGGLPGDDPAAGQREGAGHLRRGRPAAGVGLRRAGPRAGPAGPLAAAGVRRRGLPLGEVPGHRRPGPARQGAGHAGRGGHHLGGARALGGRARPGLEPGRASAGLGRRRLLDLHLELLRPAVASGGGRRRCQAAPQWRGRLWPQW